MNNPESNNTFVPRQAIAPTPELYDELVGDCMERLADLSLAQIPSIPAASIIHDNGCGTGAATAAISNLSTQVSIKGTDINDNALDIYRKQTTEHNWPAEGLNMNSAALSFPDETFTHSIGNAFLFTLPNDDVVVDALKETYRTLKPGGIALFNSWAYVPNMEPIQVAAKATRPAGTPLPRQGLDKWSESDYMRSMIEKGGFVKDNVIMRKGDFYVTTSEIDRYVKMLWSFIGGTSSAGWLKSDEENWDKAVGIVKEELKKTNGYQALDGGKIKLKFVANIAIATK